MKLYLPNTNLNKKPKHEIEKAEIFFSRTIFVVVSNNLPCMIKEITKKQIKEKKLNQTQTATRCTYIYYSSSFN